MNQSALLLGVGLICRTLYASDDSTSTASKANFALVNTIIQFEPGETAGSMAVFVIGKALPDPAPSKAPTLLDAGMPSPNVEVSVTFDSQLPGIGKERIWKYQVAVKNLPVNSTQSRKFVLAYGASGGDLQYQLTNQTGKTFSWAIKNVQSVWNLSTQKSLSIPVQVGEVPASGVHLSNVSLISQDILKRSLGVESFRLCLQTNNIEDCSGSYRLNARGEQTLVLKLSNDAPAYGTFAGNIWIGAAEKLDPEQFATTLYSPAPFHLWSGIVCLAGGVMASIFMNVLLRNFFLRKQDRQVALLLRSQAEDLKNSYLKLNVKLQASVAQWKDELDEVSRNLDDASLKKYMRPPIPQPFEMEVALAQDYKAYLEERGTELSHLRLLWNSGLSIAANYLTEHAGNLADIQDALNSIADIMPGDSAANDVAAELRTLHSKLGISTLAGALTVVPAAKQLHTIYLQLSAASLLAWLFWLCITVLSGCLVLILSNPGFGTPVDFITCALWGVGVPVLGQQATQLTPASVATSIGVQLPKQK